MRLAFVQSLVARLLGDECGHPTLAVRSIQLAMDGGH